MRHHQRDNGIALAKNLPSYATEKMHQKNKEKIQNCFPRRSIRGRDEKGWNLDIDSIDNIHVDVFGQCQPKKIAVVDFDLTFHDQLYNKYYLKINYKKRIFCAFGKNRKQVFMPKVPQKVKKIVLFIFSEFKVN